MDNALTSFRKPLPSRRFLAIGAHALSDKMLELIAKLSLMQRVTVLDLLATFLDEDVKLKDAQRLLEHSLLEIKISNSVV